MIKFIYLSGCGGGERKMRFCPLGNEVGNEINVWQLVCISTFFFKEENFEIPFILLAQKCFQIFFAIFCDIKKSLKQVTKNSPRLPSIN
jgi:hypothetical protein